MSNKHTNPARPRQARAPYNFVPLPEKIIEVKQDQIPAQDNYGFTGQFDCELETCCPTYVRGMVNEKQFSENHVPPEPFSLDGGKTPTLPGSSLRGLFRTLCEIVTYSKMSAVTKNALVYRAVGDTSSQGKKYRGRIMSREAKNHYVPKVRAGFMRQVGDKWYIQPAQEIGGVTFARISEPDIPKEDLDAWHDCKNAKKIYIQYQSVRGGFLKIKYSRAQRVKAKEGTLLQPAVLARSGRMIKKNSEAVVFGQPDPQESKQDNWITITGQTPNLVDAYRDQVSKEQAALLGDERGVLRNMQPVFYLMEEDESGKEKLIFFGHTMMMRLPYQQAPYDLIPPALRQEDKFDLTEAMFGYVDKLDSNKKKMSRAGRLFFSDATCLDGQQDLLTDVFAPKILASPKPTTFQHYLTQRYPDDPKRLRDYDDRDTTLRGFKLYWHQGDRSLKAIQESDQKKLALDEAKCKERQQYTRIQAIRPGVKFKFCLRFENLTDVELGALAWLLQLCQQEAYRLKLGMGKPLGMGAIKLQATLQLTDRKARYQNLFTQENTWCDGQMIPDEVTQCERNAIIAFEKTLLADREINPKKREHLVNLPRIKMLRKMLTWPGPDPENTRYMEIEHIDPQAKLGKRNEYKERPVLPDPFEVEQQYQVGQIGKPDPQRG